MKAYYQSVCHLIFASCLAACVRVPEGVEPVNGFELERYLGKWYEIARLDHSFERGLINVTAEYTLRDDGGVKVVNRGFDPVNNEWDEAVGRAYFVDKPGIGQLKVSFFWPFYGAYNIVVLDKAEYKYSLVAGPDFSYLWILARKPVMDQMIIDLLVQKAQALGFPVEELIFVTHDEG